MRRLRSLAKLLVVVCLLSLAPKLDAQLSDTWQPISAEDLALKDNPANPGSPAMILERKIYTDDEKRLQTEWMRIKVFTEEGRAYADVEIPYLAKSNVVDGIRARTVRPDGTVIPFDGTIYDKVVAKHRKFGYDVKAFTLPGVEVGSVVDYEYILHWKQALPNYIRHPQDYVFKERWSVPTTTWIIQQELFTRHAVFVLRPANIGLIEFATIRMSGNGPSSQPDGTMRLEMSNVAAIEEEHYMPPKSMMNSRVHFCYAGGYGDYWWNFGRFQAERADKFIGKTRSLVQVANEIAPAGDPPEKRLRRLYARVQTVRYLSYEPLKTEKEIKREHLTENKSAEDILRNGYAYGNEINYLFTALARAAGFDATIVQVVDRRSGSFEQTVLDDSQLNALVVLVRLEGGNRFFDPATRFCPYGLLPWFESDTAGVTWDRSGGEILNVPPAPNEASVIERIAELNLKPDGSLEGRLEISFTGQEALDRRISAAEEDDAGRRKLIEDEIKDLTPPGATIDIDAVEAWQDSEQPLRIKGHLSASRFATLTERRMLFPNAVFHTTRQSPFIYSSRVHPVDMRHGYKELDRITISLPPDYRLEALPSEIHCETEFATFQTKRTAEPSLLRLERNAVMREYYFPVNSYGSLRQYFDTLRQSDAENVVLQHSALQSR